MVQNNEKIEEGENIIINKPVPMQNLLKPLQHPTPTSKILATVLMVILPFIGAYVGYEFSNGSSTKSQTGWQSQAKIEQTNASITQENLNDADLEENFSGRPTTIVFSRAPLHQSTNKEDLDLAHVLVTDKDALYAASQVPYFNLLHEDEGIKILTRHCFKASACSYHDLFVISSVDKTDESISSFYSGDFEFRSLSVPYGNLEDNRSPDGTMMLVGNESELHIVNLTTGKSALLVTTEDLMKDNIPSEKFLSWRLTKYDSFFPHKLEDVNWSADGSAVQISAVLGDGYGLEEDRKILTFIFDELDFQ